jgi:hypothetical protein
VSRVGIWTALLEDALLRFDQEGSRFGLGHLHLNLNLSRMLEQD